jgi:hypothetical protein
MITPSAARHKRDGEPILARGTRAADESQRIDLAGRQQPKTSQRYVRVAVMLSISALGLKVFSTWLAFGDITISPTYVRVFVHQGRELRGGREAVQESNASAPRRAQRPVEVIDRLERNSALQNRTFQCGRLSARIA